MKALLLSSFIIALAAWTTTVQAAFHCDLAYEVLPADQEQGTLDLEAVLSVAQAEAARAEKLAEVVVEGEVLSISPAAVTWGGWQGKSSPSIYLGVKAATAYEGWPAARRLAAQLAWLYRQESVLLACAVPDAEGQELALGYSVTAEPESFFANTDGLFAFFGTLMAFAQESDLGYTRRDGAFWTIDFAGDLEEPLRQTIRFFESLSSGSVQFTLKREAVAVALVGADDLARDPRLQEHRRQIQAQLEAAAGK